MTDYYEPTPGTDYTATLTDIIAHFSSVLTTISAVSGFAYQEAYDLNAKPQRYPFIRIMPDKPDNAALLIDISKGKEWRTYNFIFSVMDLYQNAEQATTTVEAKRTFLESIKKEFIDKCFATAYRVKFQPVIPAQVATLLRPPNVGNDMAAEAWFKLGVRIFAGSSINQDFQY